MGLDIQRPPLAYATCWDATGFRHVLGWLLRRGRVDGTYAGFRQAVSPATRNATWVAMKIVSHINTPWVNP